MQSSAKRHPKPCHLRVAEGAADLRTSTLKVDDQLPSAGIRAQRGLRGTKCPTLQIPEGGSALFVTVPERLLLKAIEVPKPPVAQRVVGQVPANSPAPHHASAILGAEPRAQRHCTEHRGRYIRATSFGHDRPARQQRPVPIVYLCRTCAPLPSPPCRVPRATRRHGAVREPSSCQSHRSK